MKYRVSEILAETSLGTTTLPPINLKGLDPLSALLFEYKLTRASNTNAAHVLSNLSKIELVDGTDVIFSLSGKEIHALDHYDQAKSPYTFRTNAIGVMELVGMRYNFGRKLWDQQLALDLSRFKNPQLKVTHSPTTADASASTHSLKVVGFMFDEQQITPSGYLMSKVVKSYTCGAESSYEYTDLPLDYPIRKLLIEAAAAAYYPWQVANEIRLSENNDKRIPIDEKLSTLMKWVNSHYPKFVEEIYAVLTTAAAAFYITPSFDAEVFGGADGVGGYIGVTAGGVHSPTNLYGNASLNYRLACQGFNPHSVVPLLFGDQDNPDDWWDVTSLGRLQARVKAGSAGTNGTVSLITQQYRKY